MGLLDQFTEFAKTPEGQGLLSAAFGGLAGARRGQPLNSIGRAGLAGLTGYSGALDRQAQDADTQFKRAQQERMKADWKTEDQVRQLAAQYSKPAQSATTGNALVNDALPPEFRIGEFPGMPAQPASFDTSGYVNALMGVDPAKAVAFKQSLAKDSPFSKVDPKDYTPESVGSFMETGGTDFSKLKPRTKVELSKNGTAFDPYAVKPGTMFADYNDLMIPDGKGGWQVNTPLVGVKSTIAKSGAPSVNVKTDVKMGESLGAQVGPMMKDSTAIAEGAVKQVDASQRIVKAIESNKLYTGPGAGIRLKVGQVSQMLGVGGRDEAEKITNTRSAIRGLAELTLQGRQQMKGQGAITESEGALAERAMSGNVEDLTAAEVLQLAKASERAARFNYSEHQRKLKVMQSNPALQGVAPFYEGPSMPEETQQSTPATPPGFSIRRVR